MPPKSIFKSKTLLAMALVAIAGCLGTAFGDFGQLLKDNANGILMVLGGLGFAIKLIFKGRFTLFGDNPPDPPASK